jgi:hypothetical protein
MDILRYDGTGTDGLLTGANGAGLKPSQRDGAADGTASPLRRESPGTSAILGSLPTRHPA